MVCELRLIMERAERVRQHSSALTITTPAREVQVMATFSLPIVPAPVEYRDLAPFGYPGYRVGVDGSVWSCWDRPTRQRPSRLIDTWHRLRASIDGVGYRNVSLRNAAGQLEPGTKVHRLVLLAFVGPCPGGMECCHANDDRQDNRLSNLRWDTRGNNISDAIRNGRNCQGGPGSSNGQSVLTEADIPAIRFLHKLGQ